MTIRGLDMTVPVDTSGKIPARASAFIRDFLKSKAGRTMRISIQAPKRSTKANAYYWAAIIGPIQRALADAGHTLTSEQVHEWMKRRHLSIDVVETPAGPERFTRSTTTLTREEFAEYLNRIQSDDIIISMGVWLSGPEEYERVNRTKIKGSQIEERQMEPV